MQHATEIQMFYLSVVFAKRYIANIYSGKWVEFSLKANLLSVEAEPLTAARHPGDAVGCCIDTLHGLRSFRTHISGRAISCILILSRGKATTCLSAQREKARCPQFLFHFPHPALILLTNSTRVLPPLALRPGSLSCVAAWEWGLSWLTIAAWQENSEEKNKQFSVALQGVLCPRVTTLIISTLSI